MRSESTYTRDALRAISELEEFVAQTNRERFLADRLQQSFVFHRLVILGETAVALAKVFQDKYPEVPWPRLISLRNRLVHAYFDLDTRWCGALQAATWTSCVVSCSTFWTLSSPAKSIRSQPRELHQSRLRRRRIEQPAIALFAE